MASPAPASITPGYVAKEYALRRQVVGEQVAAFGRQHNQVSLVYTVNRSTAAWSSPLMISVADARDAVLIATEKHAGVMLDLDGIRAEYHDGWWGPNARGDGPEWVSGTVHSLTIHTASATIGIRGPATVSLHELMKIAKSIPLIAHGAR